MTLSRRFALIGLALLAGAASAQTQTGFGYSNGQDYSKSKPLFPNVLAPYTARPVPKPNFTNSSRIDQLLKDGKLMLSLNDAIVLALENNLDLSIARYNLSIADTELLRTKSGSATQGVNTGIVQGTPGGAGVGSTGAAGSGAGGTSSGAGGAGAGAGGIVTSTSGAGPAVPSFDPVFTTGLSIEHASSPQSSTILTGTNLLRQNSGTANFGYTQGFVTGTTFSVNYNNSRQTSNSMRSELNPLLSSNYKITLQQHLLQGFSLASNNRFIRIAKNNREISDVAFRLQVITSVGQIQNIYWDLVNAYENVKAKQRALDLANRLLADNEKQVKIGTLAPIEVVRAQSQAASASQDLIVAQTNLQLQQLYMKNALSRTLTDPQLVAAEVIPTDTMKVPAVEPVVPTQDLIADALSHRAELAQSYIDLKNREITREAVKNSLLPSVDLVSWYGTSALAGVQNPFNGTVVNPIATRGYGDLVSTLFGNDNPDYGVGFNVTIPIRNRSAQATQVRSELEYRQAQMRLQQLQNQIRIQVVNAQYAVQQNRARVDAATKGRQLAIETMDAEQKKYALGASTTYNVLQTQQALSTAESNLISAMAAYEQSKVSLDVATGLMLTHLGIELQDAVSGSVTRMPAVPDVVPSASVTASPATQQAQPQQQVTPQQ